MFEQQKERFSRAFIVAAAASASAYFTYTIYVDDIEGVDMTVRHAGIAIDFQLKATANPVEQDGCLVHDLDVRTYTALTSPHRCGIGVLALIVIHSQPAKWMESDDDSTSLTHCAYYLTLTGMPPTSNAATVRLRVPRANRLTPAAMTTLMAQARARFS